MPKYKVLANRDPFYNALERAIAIPLRQTQSNFFKKNSYVPIVSACRNEHMTLHVWTQRTVCTASKRNECHKMYICQTVKNLLPFGFSSPKTVPTSPAKTNVEALATGTVKDKSTFWRVRKNRTDPVWLSKNKPTYFRFRTKFRNSRRNFPVGPVRGSWTVSSVDFLIKGLVIPQTAPTVKQAKTSENSWGFFLRREIGLRKRITLLPEKPMPFRRRNENDEDTG